MARSTTRSPARKAAARPAKKASSPARKAAPAKKATAKKATAKKPAAKTPRQGAARAAKKGVSPAKKRGGRGAEKAAPRRRRAKDGPPAEVTRDLFLVWRFPRLALGNPQRMDNPVWAWLARNPEMSAYAANRHFDGPASFEVGPGWCNHRFGQSSTALSDGRVVLIGGEHEDHYDADFFIYNDVIVLHPSGGVQIFGYPHEVFPPTDFHTATQVGDRIYLIGCLGYPSQRDPRSTPVLALNLADFSVERLEAPDGPGWIFQHTAALSDDGRSIRVTGGMLTIDGASGREIIRNPDDWSLDLATLTWTRLSDRRWSQWRVAPAEGGSKLYLIAWIAASRERSSEFERSQYAEHCKALGWEPDLALYDARYSPPITHQKTGENDDYPREWTLSVDGVTVRYIEAHGSVEILFEGALPAPTVELIVEDVRAKLERLARKPYTRALRFAPPEAPAPRGR